MTSSAVFVAAAKRYAELRRTDGRRDRRRRVLDSYSPRALELIIAGATAVALLAYCMWAFSLPAVRGIPWRPLTILPFAACLLRYGELVAPWSRRGARGRAAVRPAVAARGAGVAGAVRAGSPCSRLTQRSFARARSRGRTRSSRGWGGGPGASVTIVRPEGVGELRVALRSAAHAERCPRGMGRSYGDAAQISGGLVIETTRLKRIELDAERGTVTAQAGVTIGELLREVVPAGWMVPVVPGTQHVTVGGAIASDIHGKNHGTAGTFGTHVEAISLLQADGDLVELQPGMSDRQFEATLGGMGLTGIIIDARIKLSRIRGAMLSVDTDRVRSLDDALAALAARGGPHRVAWLDLLSASPGRGVVTRAEHIDAPGEGAAVVRSRATVPRGWPAGATPARRRFAPSTRSSIARAPRTERGRPEPLGRHMFPLDSLDAWPRLYGPRGFLQYQLAVPTGAERVLELVIERLRRGRVPCYLAVLKDFGPANGAPLSFPLEGWTLALDIPRAAPELEPLLESFDRIGRRGRRARLPVERRPAAPGHGASDVPPARRMARSTRTAPIPNESGARISPAGWICCERRAPRREHV